MNIAIFHYHLNAGGVTRVIENHLAALDAVLDPADPWNVAIVHGRREAWDDGFAEKLRAIRLTLVDAPLLDYDDLQPQEQRSSADLLMEIYVALGQVGFAPQDTVLHIHNHSLGKNRQLPDVIPVLAQDGYAILLQPHDFAEDFRPANYRHLGDTSELYPQSPAIHYATLNGRDHKILATAGVESERLHLLPNPVPPERDLPASEDARKKLRETFGIAEDDCVVLYPIRCIRRKNVGEVLLLAALAPERTTFALTLAPINPAEIPCYQAWKDLAAELELPCQFDVGESGGLTFPENLAASDVIVTTSLAEGFGMVFLESWLARRPLVGRDLPEITPDFTAAGLRFDWLQTELRVPVEWIGADRFRDAVAAAYRDALDAYGRSEPPDVDDQIDAKIADGHVDFGDLDEAMQRIVIEKVVAEADARQQILDANPHLARMFETRAGDVSDTIEQNVAAIHESYSLEASGRRLLAIYDQLSGAPRDVPPQPLNPGNVLDEFLHPARFRLIRS